MSRRVLLTGATGFVGGHVARHLQAAGWDLALLLRRESDPSHLPAELRDAPRHASDGDYASILAAVEAAQPDLVVHLASCFLASHEPADIPRLDASNIRLPMLLLEAMHACGVDRFLNTGTFWQHAGNGDEPVNLYAASKTAAEAVIDYAVAARELHAITIKLSDTYGPGDRRRKLLAILLHLAADPQAGELAMSPGEQEIDLVHVADVARAFVLAADELMRSTAPAHRRYACSSGEPRPLRALVSELEGVLGRSLPIRWGGRPYRAREVMRTWRGGEAVPGWQPRVGLADGLRELLAAPRSSEG